MQEVNYQPMIDSILNAYKDFQDTTDQAIKDELDHYITEELEFLNLEYMMGKFNPSHTQLNDLQPVFNEFSADWGTSK